MMSGERQEDQGEERALLREWEHERRESQPQSGEPDHPGDDARNSTYEGDGKGFPNSTVRACKCLTMLTDGQAKALHAWGAGAQTRWGRPGLVSSMGLTDLAGRPPGDHPEHAGCSLPERLPRPEGGRSGWPEPPGSSFARPHDGTYIAGSAQVDRTVPSPLLRRHQWEPEKLRIGSSAIYTDYPQSP